MDSQGTPIGGNNASTKVTSDPRSNDAIREGAGGVASDSLAAESYRAQGGFSENRDGAPLGVSGSSTTWTTTDTQNAIRLDGASDASTRDPDAAQQYPDALGGQASFSGGHNLKDGYVGGPSGSSGSGDYSSSSAGTAPSYTLNQQGAFQDAKPKGRNLTEGGFSGEGSNYASGIGTRDDPGRAALQGLQQSGARADPGAPADYGGVDNRQPYSALDRNESA